MNDKEALSRAAQELIQGMISGLHDSKDSLKNLQLPRRGTCVVERCARIVEESCGGCRESACVRCTIAAELRAAQDRINVERDAELGDDDLEAAVDKLVESLCEKHAAFGSALAGQWYGRRAFLGSPPIVDAPHGP
jgi:hypothetical protein